MVEMKTKFSISKGILRDIKKIRELLQDIKKGKK